MSETAFNKSDYKILENLIEGDCNSPVKSLTTKQIVYVTELSLSKVRIVLGKFLLMELIQEGSKDGNNKTYYVTPKGFTHFKEAFGYTDEEMNDILNNSTNNEGE